MISSEGACETEAKYIKKEAKQFVELTPVKFSILVAIPLF